MSKETHKWPTFGRRSFIRPGREYSLTHFIAPLNPALKLAQIEYVRFFQYCNLCYLFPRIVNDFLNKKKLYSRHDRL